MSEELSQSARPGKRLIVFLMVLFVLTLGMGIGTLISYRVGAIGPGDSQLRIQTDSKPLATGAALALSQAFEEVAKRVKPAVVNINTEEIVRTRSRGTAPAPRGGDDSTQDLFRRFFGVPEFSIPEQYKRQSLGSGVIVDPKGYILTNNHVIEGATKIKVSLVGSETYTAKVVAGDELSDVAVIKIEGSREFPCAKIGDSKAMKVGDWVIAVGSPFNLEQTVTAGIISAVGRVLTPEDTSSLSMLFSDYLQTDAAINMGNSGGPLVNMSGEVVGLNSFISTPTRANAGVGFAVPSHIFVSVYNQILEKGKVARGYLGVNMNTLPFTPEMAKYFGVTQGAGVLITGLSDESGNASESGPAARAGIKAEDVIVELDGKKILGVQDLRLAVANTPPGRKVKVKVVRHGTEKEFDVTVAERPPDSQAGGRGSFTFEEKEEQPKPEIGLNFDNVPERLARDINVSGGALVLSVQPGSLAEDAGIVGRNQGGADIIIEANGKKISTAQDLLAIVRNLKTGEAAILKFVRLQRDRNNQLVPWTFYTSFVKP